jgi:hypothetical protein
MRLFHDFVTKVGINDDRFGAVVETWHHAKGLGFDPLATNAFVCINSFRILINFNVHWEFDKFIKICYIQD